MVLGHSMLWMAIIDEIRTYFMENDDFVVFSPDYFQNINLQDKDFQANY